MSRLLPLTVGLLAVGCASDLVQAPIDAPMGPAPVLLARHPELLTTVQLPSDSRDGVPVPDRIPVRGPFMLRRTTDGVHSFEAELPIRLRSLFFIHPPDGMSLHLGGEQDEYKFRRGSRQDPQDATWSFAARTLQVHLEADGPPVAGDFELIYPRASDRERDLNRAWAEREGEEDFLLRSAWQGHVERHGVLLPAPGSAFWSVTVPAEGKLSMELGMLLPEVADLAPSDGARLVVQVTAGGGEPQLVDRFELEPGVFDTVRADLAPWAGQQVELSLISEPGVTSTYDYVFVGEPTLYTPQVDPPRVVLVFVDTLRRDHLELYDYSRDTMPRLTEWSQDAVVFDAARSTAPWTLPSARALLLGAQPEFWGGRASLPERLGDAGWVSAAFVGNVYLSANFEMADGWSHHFVENWPRATDQVERLEAWLDEHPDQPAMVMLHLMDTHLPYTEPRRYKKLWAGSPPEGLSGSFLRNDVLGAAKGKDKERARQYVIDRYDGAIRYVDDQIARVLEELGPRDVAVVFSDHGEEFWDHKGFEHGHSVYEELLAVPLVIRAPGLAAGRVEQTVSLMDVTPTLLEQLGIPGDAGITGLSLLPLARGDAEAVRAFDDRLHGFGRPLYGDEQWGVLEGDLKYSTSAGKEELYDLGADPGEQEDLARRSEDGVLAGRRVAMGSSLDRGVDLGFRLRPERGSGSKPLEVTLTVPGGVKAAWVGADPTEKSAATVSVDGATVTATWAGGMPGTREVFVAPSVSVAEALVGLTLEARRGKECSSDRWDPQDEAPVTNGRTQRLLNTKGSGTRVSLSYGVAPEPPADGRELGGFDPESVEALRALGYVDDEEEPVHEAPDEAPGEPCLPR